ncbi:hypothetical protein [uncultured Sphingomonas sp.]|uniref:hypothetical protein n=1 Tax=uncultured Sphingomonas sp. TaxID=158754 RepID=UPI0035C98B6E
MRKVFMLALAPLLIGGCVRTFASVATAPVRVTGKLVDWTTTSQSEADRNYGRKMRKAEEREGRERRAWAKRCKGRESQPECEHYSGFRAAG